MLASHIRFLVNVSKDAAPEKKTQRIRGAPMPAALIKRLSNLLCVKSIVTLILTVVFADLAVTGRISSHDFLTVFSVVIAFYFGTQSERLSGQLEKDTGQKLS